jgi:hypothetical protein
MPKNEELIYVYKNSLRAQRGFVTGISKNKYTVDKSTCEVIKNPISDISTCFSNNIIHIYKTYRNYYKGISQQESFNLGLGNSIIWCSGIIVKKSEAHLLEKIIFLTTDGITFCELNIQLLIELYGRSISDDLFFVGIPRKHIISYIDQKLMHKMDMDLKQYYGIPLCALNKELLVSVSTLECINYLLAIEETYIPLERIAYNYRFNTDNAFISRKININIISIKSVDSSKYSKICFDCFKSHVIKNNNMSIEGELRFKKIYDTTNLFDKMCRLINEYCDDASIINIYKLSNQKTKYYEFVNNNIYIHEYNMRKILN